jgi:hypothetical protein
VLSSVEVLYVRKRGARGVEEWCVGDSLVHSCGPRTCVRAPKSKQCYRCRFE